MSSCGVRNGAVLGWIGVGSSSTSSLRVSDMAGSTPEAVDLSEADLVREVVAAERKRLADRP